MDKTTVTVNITSRWDDSVLVSVEVDAAIDEYFRPRAALELAVKGGAVLDGASLNGAMLVGANLVGARLDGASMIGANLDGARLDRARLDGASLDGACLDEACLDGAMLDGASLAGARLDGAHLIGAHLDRASLIKASLAGTRLDGASLAGANLAGASLEDMSLLTGARPIFMVGPIGSASRTLVAYLTLSGLRLRAGCFFGTREDFLVALNLKHGADSVHAREYAAALALIDAHCDLWTPGSGDSEKLSLDSLSLSLDSEKL